MRAVFFLLFLLPFIIPALADDALAAAGDITAVKTQAEGNNLEHDTEFARYNSLVQVDSDQMEHVTDGTKTNVIKNDRRR